MTSLAFTVHFHSPFLIATGQARAGFDATVDLVDPLRESHIKGLMSDAAARVLGLPPRRLEQIFGSAEVPSPWHWFVVPADGEAGAVAPAERFRVSIDPDTHTSTQDMLLRARVGQTRQAQFRVDRIDCTGSEQARAEALALTAAARAIHLLGGMRRRGFGWVGVTGGVELNQDSLRELGLWTIEEGD
ncbi:RAMP superfamily CRISPR-associated protein [Ornithinimicrobium kibberense]|uniref:RAMP superfamily CRISPR-associated protein n=1 Tax=Ornithinimicrobium kibberense TaxID=282060 RepID=A0ABV5V6H4_9MICO|nr:RAMP superfamily CRISPR-associated protein [Ornithinimicrobium kibberense]